MSEKHSLEGLALQLHDLGFPPAVGWQLRLHCCLAPEGFVLPLRQERNGDLLLVRASIRREEEARGYTCRYYDATLRRAIPVPDLIISEVALLPLDEEMRAVRWTELLSAGADVPGAGEAVGTVERIMAQLQLLGSTPEGREMVQRLTARHWWGTPLEPYCAGLAAVKGAWEVHQRFFLFEGGGLITLEEAYRFLLYRWRERRMQEREKERRTTLLQKQEPSRQKGRDGKVRGRRTEGEDPSGGAASG